MKLIAIGTVHGRTLISAADPKNPRSKAKFQDAVIPPGKEFETADLGIGDQEAQSLIDRKAARRKTREIVDEGVADTGDRPMA